MNRLTVLGGAAAWPNPGQGCSAYLIDSPEGRVLLDCGPDTLLELRKHTKLSAIDAIVISHCHADHILDLVTLRYALVYSAERSDTPIPLWVPPGGISILEALERALGSQGEETGDFWREAFDLCEYDPSGALDIRDMHMQFTPTQHFTECFAIRVQLPDDRTLVYGADTGSIEPLVEFARDASLLISEATADSNDGIDKGDRGHLEPEDAGAWATRAGAGRLLITHLWCEREPHEVVERAARHFAGPIDVATAGLTIYV